MPPRIAFDFAVVNALGRSHWQETLGEPGAASEGYAVTKRQYRNIAQQCEDAGVRFQPMVFEAQGEMSKDIEAMLHKLAKAGAQAEGSDFEQVKNDLLQRIALAIARRGASAIKRRRALARCPVEDICRRNIFQSFVLEASC